MIEHIIKEGSMQHVVSWNDKDGAVCSEPDCEINKTCLSLKNRHSSMHSLSNELTSAFISVEYARITPLFSPSGYSTPDADYLYHNDPLFNRRVRHMVAGVLQIVQKHLVAH